MKLVTVAKIINTHGLNGDLKVMSMSDFIEERFSKNSELYLCKGDEIIETLKVNKFAPYKNGYLVKFKDLNHINDVEKFKGLELKVDLLTLPKLENDEYYVNDLIGYNVIIDGNEVGIVTEIFPTGSNDVFRIQRENKKDLLFPFLNDFVDSIDMDEKVIKLKMIPGLEKDED